MDIKQLKQDADKVIDDLDYYSPYCVDICVRRLKEIIDDLIDELDKKDVNH